MQKIIKVKNYDQLCAVAGKIIGAQMQEKKDSVLGLATGSTMLGVYKELISLYESGEIDFSYVKTFNLDEYLGLPGENPQSYSYYMESNFFNHINIKKENTYIPDGSASDGDEECRHYDDVIESLGRADIQLLGLGMDGHIGFNEPGECFIKDCHRVKLDESTIKANSRFFDDIKDVPKEALTIGVGAIMDAKTALLCVTGKGKSSILKSILEDDITPKIPGTILQLHNNLVVIADEEALSELLA